MPVQPPRFGRQAPAKAHRGTYQHKRLRGRAGVRLRELVRREEPLCRKCLENGLTRATEEIDHIRPLSAGGSNARSNLQGLCIPCHKAKSDSEQPNGRPGGWVNPSRPARADTAPSPDF